MFLIRGAGMYLMGILVLMIWVIPIAAGVLALVTLHRIRLTQDAIRLRLEAIERLLGDASSR